MEIEIMTSDLGSVLPCASRLVLGLFLSCMLAAHCEGAGQDVGPVFPGLKTLPLEPVVDASQSPTPSVSYDPRLSQVINKSMAVINKSLEPEDENRKRVMLTQLDRTKPDKVYVDFDIGASADPSFALINQANGQLIGRIDAEQIIIAGNGYIYSVARINREFTERRKFQWAGSKLTEIKQPFQLVGLQSVAKSALAITQSQQSAAVVANIPKGAKLTVVLNDGEYYLIQTEFGLLGWLRIPSGSLQSQLVEGIYFLGD
jgi:hypothetical protein